MYRNKKKQEREREKGPERRIFELRSIDFDARRDLVHAAGKARKSNTAEVYAYLWRSTHARTHTHTHMRLENIKNQGLLLRRFYDRKRVSFFATYVLPAATQVLALKFYGKRERESETEKGGNKQ